VNRSSTGTPLRPPILTHVPPEAPPKKKKRGRWFWWLALLLLAGAGLLYYKGSAQKRQVAASRQGNREAAQPASVAASPVTRGNLPIYLRGLGTVTAFNTVNVKPRVDGPIVKVNFQEGQKVAAGELLVQIDPRPYRVALEQAQGQQARDEAQFKDAQVNLTRDQTLWSQGVIARQQLDTQAAMVGQFQGTLAADQAAIDNARLQLSFTNVTAPIAGRIGLRQVDIGNIVHATDPNPLAIITQVQPIAVLFTLPADSLQQVLAKLRGRAKLTVDAYDRADQTKIASGTLETIDNQIDVNTGTSRLKAIFNNTDGVLFPNQFVNCHLLVGTKRGVLLVIIGVSVSDTNADTRIVTANVTANSRKRRPTISAIKSSGMSTAINETVRERIVKPIWPDPFIAASSGESPASM
jgi:membrane fusion protein, multidrug efflux system